LVRREEAWRVQVQDPGYELQAQIRDPMPAARKAVARELRGDGVDRGGLLRIYELPSEAWAGAEVEARETVLFEKQICAERIESLRFSPDGRYLAAGSHDSFCYIVDTLQRPGPENPRRGTCPHDSCITALDWSLDGAVLQCGSETGGILYFDGGLASSKSRGLHISAVMPKYDARQWATFSCLGGPTVAGVQGCGSCYRSGAGAAALLAAAASDGLVRLYNYPAVGVTARSLGVRGHGGQVRQARHGVACHLSGLTVGAAGGAGGLQWRR
jgi:WD40 repeat protein